MAGAIISARVRVAFIPMDVKLQIIVKIYDGSTARVTAVEEIIMNA